MHNIHVTEGLVLSKRGLGEANVGVSLLTEQHGLIRASARSARLGVSKLRYGLEPLTLARFSLVRGRNEWRLTGVECHERALLSQTLPHEARMALGRISTLILRLVAGEEQHAALFIDVKNGFLLLASPGSQVSSVETVLVLRILSHLGYLPKSDALAPFVEGEFSIELSAKALQERALLVRAINESLKATGL